MRKLYKNQKDLLCLKLLFLSALLCAWGQQGWMGGAGPSFAFGQELVGVNARLYYGPNPRICFGPEATVFPYQGIAEGYQKSLVDLNLNIHYIFEISEAVGIYPLAGVNYSVERERLILQREEVEKENAAGLNYGLGVHFDLNKLFLFTEFKGVSGLLDDQFITAGVVLLLFKPEKETTH